MALIIIKLFIYCLLYSVIILSSLFGDYLLQFRRQTSISTDKNDKLFKNDYVIAFFDTTIHGLHSLLTWFMIMLLLYNPLINNLNFKIIIIDLLVSMLLSILIDFDHVIMAKSFSLHAIHKLHQRPFFHNTTVLLSIALLFINLPSMNNINDRQMKILTNYNRFGWLLMNATIAHHIRDALRHGLNFYPLSFLSTRPLSMNIYCLIFFIFPIVISQYIKMKNICFKYQNHLFKSSVLLMMEEFSV